MRQFSVLWIVLLVTACGGGGNPNPSPSSPAPIPAGDACNIFNATAPSGTPILNGADCTSPSPVVLMNFRSAQNVNVGACSGTLVTPRHILTAAHCLDEEVQTVRVWLGSGLEIISESFEVYPDFRFNASGFDVGVVRMDEDLPRSPVPVLFSREGSVGEAAVIVGWGRDQNNSSHRLRAGSTRISRIANGFLETIYAPPSSSVCQGDSGGPILLSEGGTWVIAGITSATSDSACNTGTNFFQSVRTSSVRDFILQHVPGVIER